MTAFLLGWLALAVTLTVCYSAARTRQKRRETYNAVFTA
jgi:hypothetical protein